jgi:hypothetical protein
VSDLQISLLLIAGVVLAGLYVGGKWQERRLLRRLGEELGGDVGDALLAGPGGPHSSGEDGAGQGARPWRIEPRFEAGATEQQLLDGDPGESPDLQPGPDAQTAPPRRSDWVEDPMLDCVLELRCTRPVDGVSFIDAAMPLSAGQWQMPVAFVVWDQRAQQWVHPDRFGYYTDALAAIQLANRHQVLDQEQIARFVATVRQAAAMLDADCDPPDVVRVAAGAAELDRLCARFDVRIGLNLRADAGAWTQARVDTAATQVGLVSVDGLHWVPADPAAGPPLQLSMPAAVSEQACLELDVPRIARGDGVVRRLFSVGGQLGALLNARIVDDNGRPIDDQSVQSIEAQLGKLFEEMKAAGIDPGGERARRLYV